MRGSKETDAPFLFPGKMIDKNEIKAIAEKFLENSSDYLVDINITPGNIITVEIDNDNGVNIDNCISLSRFIESNLDRDIEDFELTVTSVGLTTPFKSFRQYKKSEGKEVEVLTKKGEKLKGLLVSSSETDFTIEVSKMQKTEGSKRKTEVIESITMPYSDVKQTKLLIRF